MKKFRMPNYREIEERYAKGTSINYGWHTLKGLELISEQLDHLSKLIAQGFNIKVADLEPKAKKVHYLKRVWSKVKAQPDGELNPKTEDDSNIEVNKL